MQRLPGLAMLACAIGDDVGRLALAGRGDGGDQILEAIGAHHAQHIAHAGAFELEHPGGIAAEASIA